jgi:DNA polymerase III psi subunit
VQEAQSLAVEPSQVAQLAWHGVQTVLVVAVQAAAWKVPAPQVEQGSQPLAPRNVFAGHEAQSLAVGPVQLVHEAWQAPHCVSEVPVQAETWYWLLAQDEQLRHAPPER